MNNNIKKLIALISVASMVVSMAPMAFAEGEDTVEETAVETAVEESEFEVAYTPVNGVYYDEDFSSFKAGNLVTMDKSTSPNAEYEVTNGMTFSMGSRSGDTAANFISATGGKLRFSINKYTNTGDIKEGRDPKMTLSRTTGITFNNNLVINLDLNFTAGKGHNDMMFVDSLGTEYKYELPDTAYCGQDVNLTIALAEGNDTIVATAGGEIIDLRFEDTALVDLAAIYADDAKTIDVFLDNLKVTDEVFTLDSDIVFNYVKGELDIVSGNENVTANGSSYDIIGGFDLPTSTISDAVITWKAYQRAAGSSELEATNFMSVVDNSSVTIDVNKDFTGYNGVLIATIAYNGESTDVEYAINLPTVDTLLTNIANSFDITSGNTGIAANGSVYTVSKNFVVPTSNVAAVTWQAYTAPKGTSDYTASDIVTVNASNTTKITIPDDFDASAYDVKLVATISLRDVSKTLEYPLEIICDSTGDEAIYYDQNFSAIAEGTIVACDGVTSNTDYESLGMTFVCGSRSQGGGADFGITAAKATEGSSKILSFIMSNYNSDTRQGPTLTLTKSRNKEFSKGVYISADLTFTAVNNYFQISDNNGTMFLVSLGDNDSTLVGKPLTWKIVSKSSTTIAVAYDGTKPVKVIKDVVGLKNVATMGIQTNVITNTIKLENLYIADSTYSIPDADVFAADIKDFEPGNASNVTKTTVDGNVVYNVETIKDLTMPTLSFTTIKWTAKQRSLESSDSSWEPTSMMVPSGNTIAIYPTSDIEDYELKLIAELTYGTATETREYTFVLPNPMTELAAALASGYEIVTSADDAAKVINLGTAPVLKSDIKLPTTVSGCRNITMSWKSSDEEHLKINNDIAEIYTSDYDSHEVTLTATFTYKKGTTSYSQDVEFPVSVEFTADDKVSTDTMLDKYKVRFDAAYAENFSSIPAKATSNISLPTEGYFGSTIAWTSSAPTVISNSGEYKKPSATKNVIMTAAIMSGASSTTKNFSVTVSGSSSNGGGGGGGSVSSTGTVSSPSTGGAISNNITPSTIPNKETGEEIVDKLIDEKNEAENAFRDLGSVTWARDAINTLADKGIVNGKTETTFAPNDNVTRAEFAKMLMGVFGLNSAVYTTSSFNDVSTNDWYFTSVETAYNLGIIAGTGNGSFNPNALISRQEMAVMVQRAAAVCSKTPAAVKDAIVFADDADIADYAKTAVSELNAAGIINGVSEATFAPLANATRAQAAKILYSFL